MVNDCVIIPDLTWRIFNPINNQFETIYVICDTYKEKRIKKYKKEVVRFHAAVNVKKRGYETSCRHGKFF